MNGGHYTATVQSGGAWYEYDDSLVERIPETKVKSQAAYILFYRRRDVSDIGS
jgi:ubiquitin carboxyl-terminal hydrolase 4/11/15